MRRLIGVLISALALTFAVFSVPAQANVYGNDGCTPGYWKNHTDNWLESPGVPLNFQPDDYVADMFSGFAPEVANLTLLAALDGGGGSGLVGAQKILARAGVAAWLNAAHDGLGYPLSRGQIKTIVEGALASGDRDTILAAAAYLDGLNNSYCPLN